MWHWQQPVPHTLLQLVKLFPALAWWGAFEQLVGAFVVGDLLRLGVELEGASQTLRDAAEGEDL